MEQDNLSFEIYNAISPEERKNYNLILDAVYKANPNIPNLGAEVLSKLLGIKNQGGFRYIGTVENPKLVVLFSSGEDIYWKDELDSTLGIFLYYGDNKTPGNEMHKTKLHGNEILRNIFNYSCSDRKEDRLKIPPILVFKKVTGRDVKFLGLAVPGIREKAKKEWITAVWGQNREGNRFQNYKAYFSIIDTSSGSESCKNEARISLDWLNDIYNGNTYNSEFAPLEWKKYIENKKYTTLVTSAEKYIKTSKEQLPDTIEKEKMLDLLQKYFIEKDRGYSFEKFAADLTEYMDSSVASIDVTRPYKDGGFDAIGKYKIFSCADNIIYADFYLQAKCYNKNNPVVVKDTSRLISRIKDRQFGIMFTTSYVANQAYSEILEDGHPIVIINGRQIINYIYDELEIRSIEELETWLKLKY